MAEQCRGSDGTCEGDQIRYDIVDRSDETSIDDVGPSHHEPTRERYGEEELDHGESLYCAASRTPFGDTMVLTGAARLRFAAGIDPDARSARRDYPSVRKIIDARNRYPRPSALQLVGGFSQSAMPIEASRSSVKP